MGASTFFDLIHAAEGWRCLFTLPDRKHYWFKTSAELATAAAALDARGLAVFHGCATFASKSRKQEYVHYVRCLWCDIDAGPGKPYADAGAAYAALETWRREVGLPAPLVVASGGGLHAYWPLRDPLPVGEWSRLAHALRSLAQRHGLAIDAGSTVDAARILRPPGTHNRKRLDVTGKKLSDVDGEPRPVRAGPHPPAYDAQTLGVLFGAMHEAQGADAVLSGTIPDYLKQGDANDAFLRTGVGGSADAEPAQIAEHCAHVSRLRERHGVLPEPEWYAVLGVLAHCGSAGHRLAHDWSRGDDRYSAATTERKLAQALKVGPTTCAHLETLDPAPCLGCPHKGRITSPIELGRPLPLAKTASAPPALDLPALPLPYFWSGSRLAIKREPTESDPSTYKLITNYPFHVAELQEAERSGGVSAVMRSWEPSRQSWREFTGGLKDLCGDRGASALAHHGVAIDKKRWDLMRSYLVASVDQHRGSRQYGTRYEQFGWKALPNGTARQPGFVIGSDYLAAGVAPRRVFGSGEVERRAPLLAAHGEVGVWSAAVNQVIARPGAEATAFVVVCGFASILYRFTNALGGTIVHASSMQSGKGKTFAMEVAATAWGDIAGLRLKPRDTQVSKFITIGTLGNLPITFDELRQRGPDSADILKEFILHYTMGEDKARGAAEGGLKNDALPWSNIMLSAANISLLDTCLSDGNETAQAARVFEFTASLPDGIKTTEGDALLEIMKQNCGTAGRAFVQIVLENFAWVQKAVPAAMAAWEKRLGCGPQQRYALRLLGTVTVAASLLQKHGLLALDVKRVLAWAEAVALENAGRIKSDATPDPAVIVSRMMNDLVPATLVMTQPVPRGAKRGEHYPALREPRGELLARQEIAGAEFLIDHVAVKKWMQKNNYPMTELGKLLKASGIVKDLRVRRTLGAGWRRAGGQVWCWQIDGAHQEIAEVFDEVAAATATPVEGNVVELRRGA